MEPRLGIYIHIPFCASKCGYCDFYSCAGAADRMADYQQALLEHIEERRAHRPGVHRHGVFRRRHAELFTARRASLSCSTPSRPPAACSSARR